MIYVFNQRCLGFRFVDDLATDTIFINAGDIVITVELRYNENVRSLIYHSDYGLISTFIDDERGTLLA